MSLAPLRYCRQLISQYVESKSAFIYWYSRTKVDTWFMYFDMSRQYEERFSMRELIILTFKSHKFFLRLVYFTVALWKKTLLKYPGELMNGCTEISRWPVPKKRRKKKEIRERRNYILTRYCLIYLFI